jgi:hypothetical protein
MPVVFPGFSWYNLKVGKAPLDQIPRLCGAFYNRQVAAALNAGANMLYTAMFDELDEGTAIMKIVRAPEDLPAHAQLLAPDAGQCDSGSDLYLRVAGQATTKLRERTRRPN